MSANIDSMMYVGETPWHGLGVKYATPPKTSDEIIRGASLEWTASSHEMSTDIDKVVRDYYGIYRDDYNSLLGVVKTRNPIIVQNSDTFLAFENMLGQDMDIETAAGLGRGETVFGCFKVKNDFKLLDDAVDTYFVVMNEHLKPDGKVTVFNTPIRVVCQNTLSAALSSSSYKVRVPVTEDRNINQEIMNKLYTMMGLGVKNLKAKAEKWATIKVSRDDIDTIMDELFPYPDPEDEYSEKNTAMQIQRDTFVECMNADNLNNFKGSVYQVFNALTDYEGHYFKKPEKAFDLNYRMSKLPGMGTETSLTSKFIKMQEKMFA